MKLADILVDEVSLVDKAANRRQFLIVKREDPDPKPEDDKLDDEDLQTVDEILKMCDDVTKFLTDTDGESK